MYQPFFARGVNRSKEAWDFFSSFSSRNQQQPGVCLQDIPGHDMYAQTPFLPFIKG